MPEHIWWKHGIIYQVYPRSFQDTNRDGVGDLEGIRRRLNHLTSLNIDAVWISPIYPSPMADFGYDVADYCGIHPLFGSMDDFDRLVADVHARGLKLILDFVPNHSSDQHPWFVESRSSRGSPKRDWYVWRNGKPDGRPPNNWESEFGGSAWTLDQATGQYYYHAYLKEQPDLNWRNPEVVDAMCDVLRFWFERGVDGFRVDAIHHLIEDPEFRDNSVAPDWRPGMPPNERWIQTRTVDLPDVQVAIRRMREVADAYADRLLIGEAYLPIDRLMAYYGEHLTGFHLPFNFHLISTAWQADAIASLIRTYEAALPPGAWPNWVLGNHDRARVASRIGLAQARVAAMLLLTLRGTPTIYQGEEIGLEDVPIPLELVQDPFERNVPGFGFGRDPVRTPMPWSAERNGGFSEGQPWLPLNPDYETRNVDRQNHDPRSMLSLYQALIRLRRSSEVLSRGEYGPIASTPHVLTYERRLESERYLIALNLSSEAQVVDAEVSGFEVLLSTIMDGVTSAVEDCTIRLRANEGLVLRARKS